VRDSSVASLMVCSTGCTREVGVGGGKPKYAESIEAAPVEAAGTSAPTVIGLDGGREELAKACAE